MRSRCVTIGRVALLATLLPLMSCSKLSDVGEQDEPTPKAVATSIGQPFTLDSNGVMNTTVRAGSEVLLTGKESEKGANDSGVPLINFNWAQVNPGSDAVQLIDRTNNTVSFIAPQVTQDTTLRFSLTVSDAKGATASTEARVLVKPFRDEDHFLQYLNVEGTFPLALATQTAIPADVAAAATATLPVAVTLTKLVSFSDRTGVSRTRVPVGTPVVVNSSWATQLGSGTACDANQNPSVQAAIPRLDLDDKLIDTSGLPAGATLLSDVMEAADIDDATLEVRIDLSSSDAAVVNAVPVACVNGANTASVSGTIVPTETLLAAATPRDSRAAAVAYYDTIDPTGAKTNLQEWLAANGFNPDVSGWNADAHAVYTNNYDLGFGRDMYMKYGACDSGAAALPLQQRGGKCDVAAVVVNYSGVEAAAKGSNAIVAVAMEYSASPGSAGRFVKFYTFAPDTRTGQFERMLSVNLDRRGEQYMPQACVVCHGGTPGTITAGVYSNGGDVDATFLSWDLDSLLYSDTDPGFSQKARNSELRAKYTRSAQQAQFKKLNEGAYLTYPDSTRFALARELVEGWYGGAGMPNASFDGAFVPAGWKPDGLDGTAGNADDNPADSATIYSQVFASNCRSCHVMQTPAAGDPRTATVTPLGVATAIPACTNDDRLAETRVGVAFQVPMGCYWEFVHAPNLAERLSRSHMPFARRTMDRMWVNTSGGQSVGEILQAHLEDEHGIAVTTPGTVTAVVDAVPLTADVDDAVTLDASNSLFANTLAWSVKACSGTAASPGTCDRALPVVGGGNRQAKFIVDDVATYQLTLAANPGQVTTESYYEVVDKPLTLVASSSMSFQIGGTGAFPDVIATEGNGSLAKHTLVLTPSSGLTVSPSACTTSAGCAATTAIGITSSAVSPTSGTIATVVTDAGGEMRSRTVNVTVQSTFTAQPLTLSSPIVRSNANVATSLPALTAARTAVGRSDVVIDSITYTGSRSSTGVFNGTTLSYTPAAGFATHDEDGGAQAVTQEVFAYQLRRPDTGEVSSSTITVPVRARVSFNDARDTWSSTGSCAGGSCHTGAATTFGSMSYLQIRFGALTSTGNTGKAYVSTSNPTQSGLYCWPTDSCTGTSGTHFGGDRTDSELSVVRQWIEDGANNF